MENEVIFSLIGIVILIIVIILTLKQTNTNKVRSIGNKKRDIIDGYKKKIHDETQIGRASSRERV